MPASFTLPDAQAHFARTIALGPSACPPGLFAGDEARVLRGLKVHANTISHARLVALEDSFPRTREAIGEARFNALSHGYVEAGHGRAASLGQLGGDFPEWLASAGEPALACGWARFEWAWLQSYHAPEASAFTAPELAALGEAGLPALRLMPHPAARIIADGAGLADALGLPGEGENLLIARPEAEVLVYRIDEAASALLAIFASAPRFLDALETFLAARANDTAMAVMQFLLTAGVLTRG